jgi:hypothetical protein
MLGGDVGEGMFGEGYEGDVAFEPPAPFMAARCDEDSTALSAALDGSSPCSTTPRSWLVCKCDGDVFFGVVPSMIFLVEYCRFIPPPDWPPADDEGAGGDIVVS